MKQLGAAIVTILTFATSGCTAPPPADLTDAERATVTAAVTASLDRYRDAALQMDLDGLLALWANVEGFVVAGNGEIADHAATVSGLQAEMATMQAVPTFELHDRHTYVLSRDAASHTTRFRWSAILTTGDTLRVRGSWTYVFRNFGGTWQVVHSAGTHVPE